MGHTYVQVALPLPPDQTFTYRSPGGPIEPGSRVLVPFGRRTRVGWAVGPHEGELPSRVLPVQSVLDATPSLSPAILELCRWIADYYVTPLGIAIRTALPAVLADASRDFLEWVHDGADPSLTGREAELAKALMEAEGPRQVRPLARNLGRSIWPEVRALLERGLIRHTTQPPRGPTVKRRQVARLERWVESLQERNRILGRARRQMEAYDALQAAGGSMEVARLSEEGFSRSVVKGLESKGLVRVEMVRVDRDPFGGDVPRQAVEPPPLSPAQEAALQALSSQSVERPYLLHGITGSGKTRVYVEALARALARGRGGIVLVPEIALTPQTVSRFRARFGDQVAVLHSGLSDGERYDAWNALRDGRKSVAVGARSAVFAPVRDLGLIVVDEEHDSSYKQGETPRYQARDLAVVRARLEGAHCILGSATPSLESWTNAQNGKYLRLSLPDRVGGGALPPVQVLDLRKKSSAATPGPRAPGSRDRGRSDGLTVLSPPLLDAVDQRLLRSEQVILLLNRRGYSSFLNCQECGEVPYCPDCAVSLTYHRGRSLLVCHHCRHSEPAPARCGRCGADALDYRGLGTEQVERVVSASFPGARIARMDVDTTSGKMAHQSILGRVERGEVDILLGTQMIAKGLDFERVTLVGVVNADVGLHLPDFRASERTFQLLSQVAGRAGRGRLGGQVLLQTSVPDHYAVQAASRHDFEGFAQQELAERKNAAYPPFVRMANLVFSSPDQDRAASAAEQSVNWLASRPTVRSNQLTLTGPAPCPIERLHGRWRWHVLVRSGSARRLSGLLRSFQEQAPTPSGDVRTILDRDPVSLL